MPQPGRRSFDHEAIAEALRTLGMLYGTKQAFADIAAGAASEEEAIRAYIQRERPHLLASYDIDALIRLVREARASNAAGSPGVERYSPR